ncbi:MAG TPA: hypothetical protein VK666_01140, partial [Chryseolinea sp.]|nr:hypothetical protein [Chryseolinea sp.]
MYHLHHGAALLNNVPKTNDSSDPEWADRYYSFISEQSIDETGNVKFTNKDEGILEEYLAYTDFVDMQGITIHDEIAIADDSVDLQKFAIVWQKNPVGFCSPSYIEDCHLLDFAAKGTDFPKVEAFLEKSILSYTDPCRFEDYGRFIYGDSHRNILVHFDRPSFHRSSLVRITLP